MGTNIKHLYRAFCFKGRVLMKKPNFYQGILKNGSYKIWCYTDSGQSILWERVLAPVSFYGHKKEKQIS